MFGKKNKVVAKVRFFSSFLFHASLNLFFRDASLSHTLSASPDSLFHSSLSPPFPPSLLQRPSLTTSPFSSSHLQPRPPALNPHLQPASPLPPPCPFSSSKSFGPKLRGSLKLSLPLSGEWEEETRLEEEFGTESRGCGMKTRLESCSSLRTEGRTGSDGELKSSWFER